MRVVSLVPSLTEAIAVSAPGSSGRRHRLVHAIRPDLDVTRVGGTKNPKTDQIIALAPDLVIANEEENRAPDLAALREAGVEVLVTEVRDVPQAFRRTGAGCCDACGRRHGPRWLDEAEGAWSALPAPERRTTAVVPIWRRPWMVLGRDTFAGDVLARLGVDHAVRGAHRALSACPASRNCGPRHRTWSSSPTSRTASRPTTARRRSRGLPCALVSGRHLTWYGPSLAEAPRVLGEALRAARR